MFEKLRRRPKQEAVPEDPIATTERVVDALNSHPQFDVETYKHGRAVIEDLRTSAEEDIKMNRQDVVVAKQTFISGLEASGKPIEGDPVVAFMDKQLEFTDRQADVLDRISKEVYHVRGQEAAGVVGDFFGDQDQAFQRAQQYAKESGVETIVDKLGERFGQEYIKERSNNMHGEVEYQIELGNRWKTMSVNVDSEGTVLFLGGWGGKSRIKQKDWREKPELIGEGAVKALKKPSDLSKNI